MSNEDKAIRTAALLGLADKIEPLMLTTNSASDDGAITKIYDEVEGNVRAYKITATTEQRQGLDLLCDAAIVTRDGDSYIFIPKPGWLAMVRKFRAAQVA